MRKENFSSILRVEIILSVVFYVRKNIISYEKNFELTENNTFYNFSCDRIFVTIASYQFFKSD